MLRVALLEVAEATHELLARDVGAVREQVTLRRLARVVDEDVGVGDHAGDGADHVAVAAPSANRPLLSSNLQIRIEQAGD